MESVNRALGAPLRDPRSTDTIATITMPLITFVILAAEIALLLKFGQAVGGGLVLVEILATGLLGVGLLRLAGRKLFEPSRLIELLVSRPNLRSAKPTASLMYAGVLLLLPGLLTDLAGVALGIRYLLLGGRGPISSDGSGPPDTIDVDFEVQDKASDAGPEDAE